MRNPRFESNRPHDAYDIDLLEEIPPSDSGWRERRKWVINSGTLFSSTDDMNKCTKEKNTSIAVFKPTEILKFHIPQFQGTCLLRNSVKLSFRGQPKQAS